jgi:hypothetical protein
MEHNGVTSISQLPSSNQISNSIENIPQNANMMGTTSMNNIVISKNETINEANSQMQMPMQNPHIQQNEGSQNVQRQQEGNNNYNELISQLQQASSQGATSLPSRDIPSNPTQVNNDVEIKPNYVPPPPTHEDYINNMQTPEHLIQENNRIQNSIDSLELIYGEFQLPLLVCILYFLFQLPVFKKNLKKLIPSLFSDDGNPNLYGYFFNSALFATLFYILLQLINRLNIHVN